MARRIHHALVLFVLCGAQISSAAEGDSYPAVKASVEPAGATVGDPVRYLVSIAGKSRRDFTIVLPEKKELYPEKENKPELKKEPDKDPDPKEDVPLYVIHGAKKEDRSGAAGTDLAVIIELSYYRPGKYLLPEIEIRGDDGKKIGYRIPEIEIKETNARGEFENIEPPLDLGGNYTRLVLLLLGAAAAAAFGFLIAWYVKKWRMRAKLALAPEIPPIEIFMKDIENFNGRKLIAEGKIEEYVFGVALIFRRFLSMRYRFVAAEMTSAEITAYLAGRRPDFDRGRSEGELSRLFLLWDISRYAEFAPSAEMLEKNLGDTVRLAKTLSEVGNSGAD